MVGEVVGEVVGDVEEVGEEEKEVDHFSIVN